MSDPNFYKQSRNETEVFRSAFDAGLPLLITGPTGCGKTRLVEHMTEVLARPLYTVSCHDDLTSSDLVGRFLVHGGDVEWIDGPLTRAVREGAICYLDEVIEARRDTLAVLHSLTDHRRSLYLDRINERVPAADGFMLVCSYNPASRSALMICPHASSVCTTKSPKGPAFDLPSNSSFGMIGACGEGKGT